MANWGGDLSAFIRQAKTFDLFHKVRLCNFDSGGNYKVMVELGDEMPLAFVCRRAITTTGPTAISTGAS